jgi:hypothetical protein
MEALLSSNFQLGSDRERDAQIIDIIIRYFPEILRERWTIKSGILFCSSDTNTHRNTTHKARVVYKYMEEEEEKKYGFPLHL